MENYDAARTDSNFGIVYDVRDEKKRKQGQKLKKFKRKNKKLKKRLQQLEMSSQSTTKQRPEKDWGEFIFGPLIPKFWDTVLKKFE